MLVKKIQATREGFNIFREVSGRFSDLFSRFSYHFLELTSKTALKKDPFTKILRPTWFRTKIQPKVFLTDVFGNPLGSWTSVPSGHGCPHRNACFSGLWPPWPKFWSGISARMTPGCPRDIRPENFLFGLIFRSWHEVSFLTWGSLDKRVRDLHLQRLLNR